LKSCICFEEVLKNITQVKEDDLMVNKEVTNKIIGRSKIDR